MGLGSTFSEANIRNQGCGGHGTRARLSGRLARIIRIMWGLQHEPVGFGKSAFERWREDNEVAYQCCMSHPKSAVSLNTYYHIWYFLHLAQRNNMKQQAGQGWSALISLFTLLLSLMLVQVAMKAALHDGLPYPYTLTVAGTWWDAYNRIIGNTVCKQRDA